MKTKQTLTVLALTLLALVATFAYAGDEPEMKIKRQIKIALADGEEPIEIEAEGLEVGESRQFFTESGKEVVLSRSEDGLTLEVDGKEIDLGFSKHHAFISEGGHAKARVFVHKSDHGEEGEHGEHVFVHHGEGEGFHWVSDDSDDVKVVLRSRTSALEHLRDKGLLDELGEDLRQRFIEALEELEDGHGGMHHKVVVVEVDEDVHEEHDDED